MSATKAKKRYRRSRAKTPYMDPPDPKEVEDFAEEMYDLARKRFGQSDCSMDWVQLLVIDRHKYEHCHYQPVPHSHNVETQGDVQLIFWALSLNANGAQDRIERFLGTFRPKEFCSPEQHPDFESKKKLRD